MEAIAKHDLTGLKGARSVMSKTSPSTAVWKLVCNACRSTQRFSVAKSALALLALHRRFVFIWGQWGQGECDFDILEGLRVGFGTAERSHGQDLRGKLLESLQAENSVDAILSFPVTWFQKKQRAGKQGNPVDLRKCINLIYSTELYNSNVHLVRSRKNSLSTFGAGFPFNVFFFVWPFR